MRDCFTLVWLALVVVSAAHAAPPKARKPVSVVRVDARTGRLVRTVVVPRTLATSKPASPALDKAALAAVVEETARKHEVDPLLVHSVIQVESNFNPLALSHKGAQGMMQLIPSTARRFGVENVWDVKQNIEGGVKYLKYLNTLFANDLKLTLAAYNAGEGAVWKYGNSVPPYRETLDYVEKVGTQYRKALQAAQQKQAASEPERVVAVATASNEPVYEPIETFVDPDGRIHIRTKTLTP